MQCIIRKVKFNHYTIYRLGIKLVLLAFLCFLSGCIRQKQVQQVLPSQSGVDLSETAVNINTADVSELEKLPYIGAKTAQNIIEHRDKFGRFRRPELLILVRGVGDRRFRSIRHLIKVE